MIRRPPRSTRTEHSFPTRRSSDLHRKLKDCRQIAFDVNRGPRTVGLALFQQRTNLPDANITHRQPVELGRQVLPDTGLFRAVGTRSEEHTSELQSLMRISYAVFCLKKKIQHS